MLKYGALAFYALLIIYASLYPLSGWRIPVETPWQNLWSRHNTDFDVFLNVAAYVPLGMLASASLARHLGSGAAIWVAVVSGAALSFSLEGLQWFLPTRVASLLDWLCNVLGSGMGAVFGLSAPGLRLRGVLRGLRERFFLADELADAGIILILAWLLAQTNPSVPFFEAGNMINQLTASWKVNPYDPLFLIPQVVGVALNVCGFALFISVLLQPGKKALLAVSAILALGLALKLVAAGLMLKTPLLVGWLGPATILGIAAGYLALPPMFAARRRVRIFMALLLVFAGGLMSKMTSIYDAFEETLRLFDWHYGQLSSFASMTRVLNESWPILALIFLACCFVRRGDAKMESQPPGNP